MKKSLGVCIFAAILALPAMANAASDLPAGFIALSDTVMTWAEAKSFCQQKGGRLPLIDGSTSLWETPKGTPVDGFGAVGAPWPSDLPNAVYWTGTEFSIGPGHSWRIGDRSGNVRAAYGPQSLWARALCVP